MARDVSAAALAQIQQRLGTEPINVIRVFWNSDATYTQYSDKDKILSLANIDEVVKLTGSGNSVSVSVTLDDSDGSIKTLMDTVDIHKKNVSVYQTFEGLDEDDMFLLLKGEIISPIEWDEGEREVRFDIETKIVTNEIGFSPESGQFSSVNVTGKAWPLAFGSCVHIPAVQSRTTLEGTVATLFGYPDVSLAVKAFKLQERLNSLQELYNDYVEQWDLVDQLSGEPLDIQTNYIEAIINEDTQKQLLEDLSMVLDQYNDQYTTLYAEYHTVENADKKKEVLENLKKVKAFRKEWQVEVNSAREKLHELDYLKKTIETDAENAKYGYDVIGRIRANIEKVIGEYYTTFQEKIKIGRAILSQLVLLKSQVVIEGGEDFPQNQLINLNFKGLVVNGYFVGRVFTINSVLPTYVDVHAGNSLNTDPDGAPDKFWIDDSSIDLSNKYCLLSTGKVIYVSSQTGTECTFDLVEIQVDDSDQENEIVYDGPDGPVTQAIQQNLNNILDGSETPEELEAIANTIPRDISRQAWAYLNGNSDVNTFDITFFNIENLDYSRKDAEGKHVNNTYTLSYDGLVSVPRPMFDILSVDDIKQRIEGQLEGIIEQVLVREGKTKINKDGQVVELTPDKYADGYEVTVEDSPHENAYLGKTFRVDIKLLALHRLKCDADFAKHIEKDDQDKPIFDDKPGPTMTCTVYSVGAHEHTFNKRTQMVESAISKSAYGTELKFIRTKISDVIGKLNKANKQKLDAVRRKQIVDNLQKYLSAFWKLIKKLDLNSTIGDEAFKLINDEEYRFLYDLELLHYMEFKRSFERLEPDFPGGTSIYYITGTEVTHILQACPIILPSWGSAANVNALPTTRAWVANPGTRVTLNNYFQEKYVANILPSSVKGVYAYRVSDNHRLLTPLPSRYYIKNENENYGDFNATTITLIKPLRDYLDEGWEDEIYVSLISSVGPNTVNIIKHISDTYTNLSTDSTTFDSVRTLVANYPSHFCLFDQPDALKIIEEIAYQARCAVWIKNETLYIRYLPLEPDSIKTITESDIEAGSFKLTHTETEDVVTKSISEWRRNYLPGEPNKLILRHNMKKYGRQEETYDYFIYNVRALVLKSSTFWLIRHANTWKRIKFNTFLTGLQIETFDCITLDLSPNHIADSAVKCIVEKVDYDSNSNNLSIEAWVPVRLGEMSKYNFAWPAGISVNDEFPSPEDIISGNAGNPFSTNVPSGESYDPYNPEEIEFRPQDYGDIKLSDTDDSIPVDPTTGMTEVDFTEVNPAPNKLPVPNKAVPDDDPIMDVGNSTDKTDPSLVNDAEGKRDNMSFIGTVIKFVSYTETLEQTQGGFTISKQLYSVQRPDGRIVKAYQMQILNTERIPEGTKTVVIYEPTASEYQMQVPVWLGEPINDDDEEEEEEEDAE